PNAGYELNNWSIISGGSSVSLNNENEFVIVGATTITANYSEQQTTFTFYYYVNSSGGTVTSPNAGLAYVTHTYNINQSSSNMGAFGLHTLYIQANPGYTFDSVIIGSNPATAQYFKISEENIINDGQVRIYMNRNASLGPSTTINILFNGTFDITAEA